ncbi:MAG: helix-turn-helix domain-containing protein [Candidatus Kapabacteria bacterium]|nr:helix-turn-helix domain-containing protein [Candidatus Kapabacteria bacterium]
MKKKFTISLSAQQRLELNTLKQKRTLPKRLRYRISILLMADEQLSDTAIMKRLDVSLPTICRVRRRFVTGGMESALYDRPRSGAKKRFCKDQMDAINSIISSPPPNGSKRWSLRLIADTLIRDNVVKSISYETVRVLLASRNTLAS